VSDPHRLNSLIEQSQLYYIIAILSLLIFVLDCLLESAEDIFDYKMRAKNHGKPPPVDFISFADAIGLSLYFASLPEVVPLV